MSIVATEEPVAPKDPIEELIKRIMYAEGDLPLSQQDSACAKKLKEIIPTIVHKLCAGRHTKDVDKDEESSGLRTLDMGLVRHVFSEQLRWFYKTKSLTKTLKQPGETGDKNDGGDADLFREIGDDDQMEYDSDGEEEELSDNPHNGDDAEQVDIFTKDHVGKLADSVTKPLKLKSKSDKTTLEERKEDHFKSVLRDLEENVSSDDDDGDGDAAGESDVDGKGDEVENKESFKRRIKRSSLDKDRQYFIYTRVQAMTESEYMDFI